jgi:hypothetical protein
MSNPQAEAEEVARIVQEIRQQVKAGHQLTLDNVNQLTEVLLFIPKGPPRQWLWPETWIQAVRLLKDHPEALKSVASSGKPNYLSVLGALYLFEYGDHSDAVLDWLSDKRDYSHLTAEERQRLDNALVSL